MEITQGLIAPYYNGQLRHPAYDIAVDKMEHLMFHFDGHEILEHNGNKRENKYFDKLILKIRPGETEKIRNYRKHIYVDETTFIPKKVLNTLKKIPKANDWSVSFKQSEVPAVIQREDSLESYTTEQYPIFGSLTNWMFDFYLRKSLIDPNGICYVLPEYDVQPNEYLRPTARYVSSDDLLEFKADELAIIRGFEMFHNGSSSWMDKVLRIIARNEDRIELWEALPIKVEPYFQLQFIRNLDAGQFPAWRIGGESVEMIKGTPVYNSYVHEMLPPLDKAARETNDLDSSVILHLFPTMWYVGGQACDSCQGTGQIPKDGKMVVCGKCKGGGSLLHSPYTDIEVKKAGIGEPQTPTPPVGYAQKDIDPLELQDKRIDKHYYKALSAVNMEFLSDTPLNQSGKAKEVDKDELNTFVYDVAKQMINTEKKITGLINDYRYSVIVPNEEIRNKMLPTFNYPQDFSILTSNQRLSEVGKAREAKVDAAIIAEQEKDYANSQFKTQPIAKGKVIAIININPFPGRSSEEIDNGLLAGTITKKDAVISTYVCDFVENAISDNQEFINLPIEKQKDIISNMADAKILELNAVNTRPAE